MDVCEGLDEVVGVVAGHGRHFAQDVFANISCEFGLQFRGRCPVF